MLTTFGGEESRPEPSVLDMRRWGHTSLKWNARLEWIREKPVKRKDFEAQVASVAALKDDTRRRLYLYVVGEVGPVGREEAARAVGIGRTLAAFHLDRLVKDGLLDVEYRRLSDRTGPGAGRTAKLYRRSARQVDITLPERRYDLAGWLLARTVSLTDQTSAPVVEVLSLVARQHGADLAGEVRQRASQQEPIDALRAVLGEQGYEPAVGDDGVVVLRNCPFRFLAEEHPELICGMNHELLRGLLAGVPEMRLETAWDPRPASPRPPACCVRVLPAEVGLR